MNPPTTARLLQVWEQAAAASTWTRPLRLLAASDCDFEDAAALPLGNRDARLLQLQTALFGAELTFLADCPKCKQRLEWAVNSSEFQCSENASADSEHSVQVNEFNLRFRLPNTHDVAAAAACQTVEQARRLIFERCVLALECRGQNVRVEDAPEPIVAAAAQRMADADPVADIELALSCPACGHPWNAPFDVATHLWTELNAWAQKRLEEVHLLASAYGWGEAEILQLSPARRRYYLEAISLCAIT